MWCRLHPRLLCCYGYLHFLRADSRWENAMNVQVLVFFTVAALFTCDSDPQCTRVKLIVQSNTLNLQGARQTFKHIMVVCCSIQKLSVCLCWWDLALTVCVNAHCMAALRTKHMFISKLQSFAKGFFFLFLRPAFRSLDLTLVPAHFCIFSVHQLISWIRCIGSRGEEKTSSLCITGGPPGPGLL